MVDKRDRIIDYLKSLNITVNISKNKARGHKGFFRARDGSYRIDIAKGLDDNAIMRVLAHEFMHYVHYLHDKNFKSLDFIFDSLDRDIIEEELISLTVHSIPKSTVKPLFDMQNKLKEEVEYYLDSNTFANKIIVNYKTKLLRSVNSKISRLNRYYNSPGELLARSFELYLTEPDYVKSCAPYVYKRFNDIVDKKLNKELCDFVSFFCKFS